MLSGGNISFLSKACIERDGRHLPESLLVSALWFVIFKDGLYAIGM